MTTNELIADREIDAEVFQRGEIWNLAQASARPYSLINTGFTELEQAFSLGGWPLKTTTEIALSNEGIGELRLLLPAIQNLINHSNKPHMIWVCPPHTPYARAFLKQGIDTNRLILIKTKNPSDTLWAAEQILLANSCCILITWTGRHNLSHKESRRLQLAASRSDTWHVQFRHPSCLQQPSAARMRLHLQSRLDENISEDISVNNNKDHSRLHKGRLLITVVKQPFGHHRKQCAISLPPHYEKWRRTPVRELPDHNRPLLVRPKTKRINAKASVPRRFIGPDTTPYEQE